MARVKIFEPTFYIYKTQFELRVTDMNYGNHLGNDRVLALAQEIRCQFFEEHSWSEFDIGGTSLIQGDAAVIYQGEGHAFDLIEASLSIADMSNSSFDIIYQFINLTKNKKLALVKTGMVCFNYDTSKVQPIPEYFERKIEELEKIKP